MTAATIPADATSITRKRGAKGVGSVVEQLIADAPQQVEHVELARLHPNPDNPRESVGDIIELADSIRSVGILEPLIVARAEAYQAADDRLPALSNDDYVVIAGHRRLAGADLACVKTVPCIVRDDLVGADADVAMLVENIHREGLTPLEEARSYQRLASPPHSKSQRDIAKLVGCNQSHVSKRMSLLDLPADVQADVACGGMPLIDALAIAKHADNPTIAKAIVDRPDWQSVDEAAEIAQRKIDRATAIVDAKERLKTQGITKIVNYDHWELGQRKGKPRALKWLAEDGVDVDEHIHFACHAVAVGYNGAYDGELYTVPVCTKPTNHPESADVKRNEQDQRAKAKRDREAKMGEKRKADRLEAIRAAVASAAKISADTQAAANLILFHSTVVESFDEDEFTALIAVLGVTGGATLALTEDAHMYARMDAMRADLLAYVELSPADLKRALAAAALVRAEDGAERHSYSTGDSAIQRALLEWLPEHGYKLSTVEKQRLKDAVA